MSKLPAYEVLHDECPSASGYSCTNEEPERFRELLHGKVFKRVLSICSGGEVPLLVLLPRTTQEVVAVDHSKRSLMATYLKVAILNKYGPKESKQILTSLVSSYDTAKAPESTSTDKVRAVLDQVPADLLKQNGSFGRDPVTSLTYEALNLKREWALAREQDLSASIKKLHLLKLVLGDLTDVLKKHDPFELFYFSNAFEHQGRNGKYPNPREIEKLVIPGGLILTAGNGEKAIEEHSWVRGRVGNKNYDAGNSALETGTQLGWERLKVIKGKRASWSAYGMYQTDYCLHRVPDGEVCGVCGVTCECVARKVRVNRAGMK